MCQALFFVFFSKHPVNVILKAEVGGFNNKEKYIA